MAIVKMKRLRLMVHRADKDELLRQLLRLGYVEFSEIGEELKEEESSRLVTRESGGLTALKSQQTELGKALSLLEKYAPKKTKLLSAPPELEEDAFLSSDGLSLSLKVAENILSQDDRIKRIAAEESRQRGVMESLAPWLELEMSLDTEGTKYSSVVLGSLPARLSLDEADDALALASEEAELFRISGDKSQNYVVLVCAKTALAACQECLRGLGFTASAVSGMSGTARECTLNAKETLESLAKEKAACVSAIVDEAVHREEMKLSYDRLSTKIALAEAEDKLYGTSSTVVMEGWMPAEREAELASLFEKYSCAWDTRDPEEDEYPQVPVQLKNNTFTNSMNMVIGMYSLPAYGTVDANPMMAPFFILFYGLMMADMGYGLIMIAAALVAMTKIKPRGGTLSFCQLLLYGGISTLVMGALTGSFFGDAPYQLVHMFDPNSTWEGLPYLFSPVHNSNAVLYGSMVLGLVHLITGMIISFVQKTKAGNLADAIFEEGSIWVIFIGAVPLALGIVLGLGAAKTAGIVILVLGVVMLLFGAGRHSKGFGKVTAAVGCVYNTLTGWFGDILSYSRIMALMLAGGVVAQVFNTIAAMPAQSLGATNPIAIVAFILIFLIGHVLNFGLNILGCFVHDLRLQCLEFFGKFFTDGGRPFQPLQIRSKYARPREG